MLAGKHCIQSWQPEEITDNSFPVQYAAPVNKQLMLPHLSDHLAWGIPLELRTRYGWIAATLAIEDCNIDPVLLRNAAVLTASGAPHHFLSDMLLAIDDNSGSTPDWRHVMERQTLVNPHGSLRQKNDRLAQVIATDFGSTGPVLNISSACAGAAQAIGNAMHMIRRGETEIAIAGGADSVLNLDTMTALYLLGAASTEQRFGNALCRPFDRHRSGLVAGEGGGFVVLESLEHALARNATIYAELAGYGSSLDGYKVTAPEPTGRGAILSMQAALRDANIQPEDVDVVNAHGTSTPLNDIAETYAIKKVFSNREHYKKLLVSANKSQFGHLIAAAAAPEVIVTALSCLHNRVTPTLNLQEQDPECDLNYCPEKSLEHPVNIAISNSFGFGGLNTTLVVRKYEGLGAK